MVSATNGNPIEHRQPLSTAMHISRRIALALPLLLLAHVERASHAANLFQDAQQRQHALVQAVLLRTHNALNVARFHSSIVFRSGHLQHKWLSCSQSDAQADKCHLFAPHDDRVSFQYTFDHSRRFEYRLNKPTVSTRSVGAHPVVNEFQIGDAVGTFSVLFACDSHVSRREWLQTYDVNVPITEQFTIRFTLIKRCISGVQHPYVELLFLQNRKWRTWHAYGVNEFRVSASTAVSTFVIRVSRPATAVQYNKQNFTNSSPETASLVTRGLLSNGTFVQGDHKLWLLYECHRAGSTSIHLQIQLAEWKPLRLHVNKSCGGSVPRTLSIGTNAYSKDVLQAGVTQASFMLNSDSMYTLPETERALTLYVRNDGAGLLQLGSVLITSYNHSVCTASVQNWRQGELHHARARTLQLGARCTASGSGLVRVSLPVLQHGSVELFFRKLCMATDGVTLHRHSRTKALGALAVAMLLLPLTTVFVRRVARTWRTRGYRRARHDAM